MTLLTWLVVAGLAGVAACTVAAQWLPAGTDPHRRAVAGMALVGEVAVLPGLLVAALHLATRVNSVCPTDAACSVPYSWPALVGAPLLVGSPPSSPGSG